MSEPKLYLIDAGKDPNGVLDAVDGSVCNTEGGGQWVKYHNESPRQGWNLIIAEPSA